MTGGAGRFRPTEAVLVRRPDEPVTVESIRLRTPGAGAGFADLAAGTVVRVLVRPNGMERLG